MATPRLLRFESIEALRNAAQAWDDLWWRSDSAMPTGRAELIAQWLEHFAPQSRFLALAVEQDGQLIAALPLVQRRVARVVRVGSLPWNTWIWAGDLLLDPAADAPQALAVLIAQLRRAGWPLLWFDTVPFEAPHWRQMLLALDQAGLNYVRQERFAVGALDIAQLDRDWDAYQQMWSKNHRKHMKKMLRRADEAGGVELEICTPYAPEDVQAMLQAGFEVEHRSWKGRDGTSVLANPAMRDFYLRQATQLAHWGQLELVFLRHQGRAIAFEYGWSSKGVYFSPKVGYDEAFARLSPGQLIRYKLYEQQFAGTQQSMADFCGPLADATVSWATRTYPVSRLVVETGGLTSRALLWTYRHVWGRLRKLRRQPQVIRSKSTEAPPPGQQVPLSAEGEWA